MPARKHMLSAMIALLGALPASGAARAQDANGRYVMSPTQDGFLKLDTRTGDVSECRRADGGFRCTLTPDERTALQGEVDRLTQENASLRQSLAGAGVTPPAAPQAKPAPNAGGPSDQEFDRALTLMERFLRRFMTIMKDDPSKTQDQL
ncbi:MAG: hypothetical protein U1E62_15020 [Alsobacter sp.]